MREIPPDIGSLAFDLIIVGAGINGAGIARDAAMRGLKVLLLEKGDVASGTSAWSTRLIHGGLRYLEHGEVGLVRESLRERERLLRIAPHLVRPLPLLIPVYGRGRRGPLTIRAGMAAYDLLSLGKSLERHRMLSPSEALARAPGLSAEGLRGAALYYDAQVEFAERLVLENVLSARAHGALVLTYARVESFVLEGNRVLGVRFTDLLGGGEHSARGAFTVNVSGPWVDEVLSGTGRKATRMIGGTKGSHLIVDRFEGAPSDALYAEARADGRPFFIIPWNGLYLIGTTDLPYEGDLDRVEAYGAEIDYLLAETNHVIPRARLGRDSVLYTYSGVRPLPYVREGAPSGITRKHFIRDHSPDLRGLVSVVGGKLTTYRNLAEQAVDLLLKRLGKKGAPCATDRERLPGAGAGDFDSFSERFTAESGLPGAVVSRLLRVYGARAADVLELARDAPELLEPFSPESGALGAEVLFSFRHELAETLTDCLMRRTMVGLNRHAGLDSADSAARVAQRHLGWTRERAEGEVRAYVEYVGRFHPRAPR